MASRPSTPNPTAPHAHATPLLHSRIATTTQRSSRYASLAFFGSSIINPWVGRDTRRKIKFAETDPTPTPKRSNKHTRSRAKSPSPFPHTVQAISKVQSKRKDPISAIDLERQAQRRKVETFEESQAFDGNMATMRSKEPRILVINPNTSMEMTNGLAKLVRDTYDAQRGQTAQIELYTALKGSGSIDNEGHAMESARCVIDDLVASGRLSQYDAFLVACYSVHPLVGFIRGELEKAGLRAHVLGIFEASILTALSILPPFSGEGRFGIVSTGKYWEKALSDGVRKFLGADSGTSKFAAVSTTGLNADQLHSMPEEEVRKKMKAAVKSLMEENGDVSVVVLGCAGMAGLNDVVREALVEKYGEKVGKGVFILDSVKCGIGMLESLLLTVPLERVE